MPDIERFRVAQDQPDSGFDAALREIESRRKTGHWIWYVFPQAAGLGLSEMSQRYAVGSREEAEAYLDDETLRGRLLTITRAVAAQINAEHPHALRTLMGSETDARKLVSSLTLFELAARAVPPPRATAEHAALAESARTVLDAAEAQGLPRCAHTGAWWGQV